MSRLNQEQAFALLHSLDQKSRFGVETGRRLLDLAEIIGDQSTASLGAALETAFPGTEEKQALEQFRKWRAELKKDAKKRGSALEVKVDSKKRAEVSERTFWFEGEVLVTSNREPLVAFSEAAAADKPMREQVPPRGREIDPKNPSDEEPWTYCVLYPKSMAAEAKGLCDLIDAWFKAGFSRMGGPIAVGRLLSEGDKYIVERSELCLVLIGHDDLAEACAELPDRQGVIPVRLGLGAQGMWAEQQVFGLKGRAFTGLPKAKRDEFIAELHKAVMERLQTLPRKPRDLPDSYCAVDAFEQRPDLPKHAQRTRGKEIELGHADRGHERGDSVLLINSMRRWAADPSAPVFGALLGEYGMGKTTTCRMLTHDLNNSREVLKEQPPVVYLDLRELQTSAHHHLSCEQLVDKVLERSWLDTDKPRPTAKHVIDSVRTERAVVIFDGLDEVLNLLTEVEGQAFTRELWRILPPGYKPSEPQTGVGKILISCRTHFFKTLDDARNHLLGEQRASLKAKDYVAWIVSPFDVEQIKSYLAAALPERDPQDLLDLFGKIHNLTDLATRPYTLELVSAQIESLERKFAAGEGVNTADLYDGFIERWLHRDTGKHQIKPEHKRKLMQYLAAEMWRDETRNWSGEQLEEALIHFLDANPLIDRRYRDKDMGLLEEDLRNATFVVWGESSGFRFAHTSMQEFFLADYLVGALGDADTASKSWAMRKPSEETFDFIADRIHKNTNAKAGLQALLRKYAPLATRNALDYARGALTRGHWTPSLSGLQLIGEKVPYLHFKGSEQQLFDLRGADLRNCHFNHSDWSQVDLRRANVVDCELSQAVMVCGNVTDSQWSGSVFSGDWYNSIGEPTGLHRSRGLGEGEFAKAAKISSNRGGHCQIVRACAFDPAGQRIVSASDDSTLRLWDSESGECLWIFEGHQSLVESCAFDPAGQRIVSASWDETLRLWDSESGECLRIFEGHQDKVTSCTFDPTGQRIVSASWDDTLRLWDSESGECLRIFEHTTAVTSCAFDPAGQRIVSASWDDTLRLWDSESGECLRVFEGHQDMVTSCTFDPTGRRIVSASRDDTLRLWGSESGECLRVFEGHRGTVESCAFDLAGQRIVSASTDDTLRLWDSESGECLRVFEGHRGKVESCAFEQAGQHIVSVSVRTLRLWASESGECLRVFEGHQGTVTSCAFDSAGQRIVSASWDETLRLWDSESGECLRTFKGHQDMVTSCAFDPAGHRIVSASWDSTLRLWDSESGECLRVFEGHQGTVTSCAFDPAGQRITSASHDGTVRLWCVESGECLQVTYAALPQGHATFRGRELVAAEGPLWRYLVWYAPDEDGAIMPYTLEAGLNEQQRAWLSYE